MQVQFTVDAFENGPFTGNPAAVVPLEAPIEAELMQQIAEQNNLSETAFFVVGEETPLLRWFTPTDEVPLCGHATLATGHVVLNELGGGDSVTFDSASGLLTVSKQDGELVLDFPERSVVPGFADTSLLDGLGTHGELFSAGDDAFVVLADEATVHECAPDLAKLRALPGGMVILSAASDGDFDIVARVFAPQVGIPEDPATGAAHCSLVPFWTARLGKSEIRSFQASSRGGHFHCRHLADRGRVALGGTCRTFARGEIDVGS